MSNAGKAEFEALDQLEEVLRHVAEELASWRRRALKAEAERSVLGGEEDVLALRERLAAVEVENTELTRRLAAARERLEGLLERLRFLEEQTAMEEQRS